MGKPRPAYLFTQIVEAREEKGDVDCEVGREEVAEAVVGKAGTDTVDVMASADDATVQANGPGTDIMEVAITIILADDTFTQLAEGKLDGQKAFMTGKLKTKGNMMLATKLDGVLKVSGLISHIEGRTLTSACRRQRARPSCNMLLFYML